MNPKLNFATLYKPEWFRERYGTKEQYARHCAGFRTYAFLTPDGEWNEPGEMGWFGMDNSTPDSRASYDKAFDKYLAKARQTNLNITIVDCHI